MKRCILSTLLMFMISQSHAGLYATTAHSRANCINNESITWWANHSFNWRVVSVHGYRPTSENHGIDTGYEYTWRQAAVHWNEAPLTQSNWDVSGFHFWEDYAQGRVPFEVTTVKDCSIYDGWWG